VAIQSGRPEVHESGSTIAVQENVLRFDVAVENPARMSRGERSGDARADPNDVVNRDGSSTSYLLTEIASADPLHHDEAPRPVLLEIVQSDDVRMQEAAHCFDLPSHPLACDLRRRWRWHQQLDGHIVRQLVVAGSIDNGVSSAADLLLELVPLH
jgi:hypothetical protein